MLVRHLCWLFYGVQIFTFDFSPTCRTTPCERSLRHSNRERHSCPLEGSRQKRDDTLVDYIMFRSALLFICFLTFLSTVTSYTCSCYCSSSQSSLGTAYSGTCSSSSCDSSCYNIYGSFLCSYYSTTGSVYMIVNFAIMRQSRLL